MAIDFYTVLGLKEDATQAEVKRAYRRAALKCHPDVNKAINARQQFMEVVEAYETLSDEKKRREYDRRRRFGVGFGGGFGAGGAGARGGYSSSSPPPPPPRGSTAGAGDGSQYDKSRTEAWRWQEQNPRADEIDDSFGRILGDVLAGIAGGAVSGKGVLDDFVTFLENQVEGFGTDTDADFEDLLATGGVRELRQEGEAAELLLQQLRRRAAEVEAERGAAVRRAAAATAARAGRAAQSLGELDQEMELVEKAAGLRARGQELQGHIKRADRRLKRLQRRIDQFGGGGGGGTGSETYGEGNAAGASRSHPRPRQVQAAVEDELRKLKKDLGMQ